MKRKIIKIDEERCNGCGACVTACHEGAIGMVDGKARLLSDHYCDGLGDCLPACPTGAITFEEREAAPYDEAAVKARMQAVHGHPAGGTSGTPETLPCGCPGTQSRRISRTARQAAAQPAGRAEGADNPQAASRLAQWPVQIKLAPVNAPYFDGCHLLIAADCTAYAYGNFHQDFIRGRVTLIGCPKLDEGDYTEKLTAILAANDVQSVTVVRMTVPCCGGIQRAVQNAVAASGKNIPLRVAVVAPDGTLQ